MRGLLQIALVVGSITAVCASDAQTQGKGPPPGAQMFKATASVKTGSTNATADVVVMIHNFSSEEQRGGVLKAVRQGGTAAAVKALAALPDAGIIQVGGQVTPIKYAARRDTSDGYLLTVVTGKPIAHLGASLPEAKSKAGYDVAVALLDVKNNKDGVGELAPAAKIRLDQNDAIVIEDYGSTVVWLKDISRAR